MSATPATKAPPSESDAAPNRWLVLFVLLAGGFIILLDATIVNVAIPSIQDDLGASYEAISWVVSGYALSYGLLLIPSGRLGDKYGHKRLFVIGLVGFTVTSALCGFATSPAQLVLWRVLQGVMAGVLTPQILAVIQKIFPPHERGKAFGAFGAMAGFSTALGPLLGGLLISWNLQGEDWRPIFLVNIPIGVVTVALALKVVPEHRGRAGSIDVVGVTLVTAALMAVFYPLVEGRDLDWPLWTFLMMAAALPLLALFVWWELRCVRRGDDPLVDVRLFANRSFSAGVLIGLCFFAGFIGLLFTLSLFLQNGLGRSALAAGLTVLPFALGNLVGAAVSDKVAARLGRHVLHVGATLVMLGLGAVIAIVHYGDVPVAGAALVAPLVVAGLGSGLIIAPNTGIVLAGVPRRDAGSASGVLNTAQRVGQAIGIAVVGVVLFGALASYSSAAVREPATTLRGELVATGMPEPAAKKATDGFVRCFNARADATNPTATPPGCSDENGSGATGRAFARAAEDAVADDFTHAFVRAALVSLGAIALTWLAVFLLPRRTAQSEAPQGDAMSA